MQYGFGKPEGEPRDISALEVPNSPLWVKDPREGVVLAAVQRVPLLLQGPKGAGKSVILRKIAHEQKWLMVKVVCSAATTEGRLISRLQILGGTTWVSLGPVVEAVQVALANPHRTVLLLLEEVNALTEDVQKALNPLLDDSREIYSSELGRGWRVPPNLLIAASGNPPEYSGVTPLNEDFASRWGILPMAWPSEATERAILRKEARNMPEGTRPDDSFINSFIENLLNLAKEVRADKKALSYPLSTRDMVLMVRTYTPKYPALFAALVAGKYDAEEAKTFKARVQSIFAINPDTALSGGGEGA